MWCLCIVTAIKKCRGKKSVGWKILFYSYCSIQMGVASSLMGVVSSMATVTGGVGGGSVGSGERKWEDHACAVFITIGVQ